MLNIETELEKWCAALGKTQIFIFVIQSILFIITWKSWLFLHSNEVYFHYLSLHLNECLMQVLSIY